MGILALFKPFIDQQLGLNKGDPTAKALEFLFWI